MSLCMTVAGMSGVPTLTILSRPVCLSLNRYYSLFSYKKQDIILNQVLAEGRHIYCTSDPRSCGLFTTNFQRTRFLYGSFFSTRFKHYGITLKIGLEPENGNCILARYK